MTFTLFMTFEISRGRIIIYFDIKRLFAKIFKIYFTRFSF